MAIAENLILEVKADVNKAVSDMNRLNTTMGKSTRGVGTFTSAIGKWVVGLGAAAASIHTLRKALQFAFDASQYAAQISQVNAALNSMAKSAGTTANAVLMSMRKMSGGTVDDLNLMKGATRAALFDIPLDKLDELMQIARASATATGESIEYMFNSLVTGIGRNSPMLLDNLGLTIRIGEATEKYAAEVGKSAEQLTITERKQALLNDVLRAGNEIMKKVGKAGQEVTDAERWQILQAAVQNLKGEIGQGLLPVFKAVTEQATELVLQLTEIQRLSNAFQRQRQGVADLDDKLLILNTQLEQTRKTLASMTNSYFSDAMRKQVQKNIDALEEQIQRLEYQIAMEGSVADAQKKRAEAEKIQAEERAQAAEEEKKRLDEIWGGWERLESILDETAGGFDSVIVGTKDTMAAFVGLSGVMPTVLSTFEQTGEEVEETAIAVGNLSDQLNKLRHAEEYINQVFITSNSSLKTQEELLKELADKAQATAEKITGVMEPFTDALGQMFTDTEKGWAMFADAAKKAIAKVLEMLSVEALAEAGLAFASLNIPKGIALSAAGAALLVASGVVKGMKEGGVVTKPTMAMIGESGPEAVIPLNKAGGMGSNLVIVQNIRGSVFSERQLQRMAVGAVARAGRGY